MPPRKRFFTRHPLALRVRVRGAEGWIEMVTIDVSRRGLFVRTDKPIPAGRIAQMEVTLPDARTIEAMGHVRRSIARRDGDETVTGMGIEFFVMSKEAQDTWDAFVLERKRSRSRAVESGATEPTGRVGVVSDAVPGEVLRLSGLPPDMGMGSSEPPLLAEDPAEEVVSEIGVEPELTDEPEVAVDPGVAVEPEVEPGMADEPGVGLHPGGQLGPDLEVAPELDSDIEVVCEIEAIGAEFGAGDPLDPAAGALDSADDALDPAEQPHEGTGSDSSAAGDGGDEAVDPALLELVEGARDAAAETEAVDLAYITVTPSDVDRLAGFVERKLRGGNIFLRTRVRCRLGQVVELTLVHPETDVEHVVTATVRRTVGGPDSPRGVLLRFDPVESRERAALQRFVATGHAEVEAPTTVEEARLQKLREAVAANPGRPEALLALAWGCLAEAEDAAAAREVFLEALAADSADYEIHLGLAIAYALEGDVVKSYAFVRSARTLHPRGAQS